MKRRFLPAFTLIELMVVITIISILASISIIGSTSILRETRDDARKSQSTIIAEALEKYYVSNNEYPSVPSLTPPRTINDVKQKLSIKDNEVLTFPTVPAGTSVLVASNPSPARLTYVAQTTDQLANGQCQDQVDGYCDAFALQYIKESDNSTVTINSRHNAFNAVTDPFVLSQPTQPAVNGSSVNSSVVRFTASSATCSVGSVEYKIRYNTSAANVSNMPAWSTVAWGAGTTKDVPSTPNKYFYSQSLARCVSGSASSEDSSESAIDTWYVPPASTAPGNPVPSASASSYNAASVTWGAVSGTAPITYTVRYGTSSGTYGSTACTSISTTSCPMSGLAPATTYYIQVTASNGVLPNGVGTTSVTTQGVPPTPPSSPVVNASTINAVSIQVSWSASSGTAPITYSVSGSGNASSCTSSPCTVSGLSPSTAYTFTVTASNSGGSSSGQSTATTQDTVLTFSRGATQPNSNVTLSWSYTNGYSASGSFNVTGTAGTGCTNVTGSYCYFNRTTCSNTPTITLTGPDSRTNTLVLDAVSPPTSSPNISMVTKYGNGFKVTWGLLPNATYYPQRVYLQPGGQEAWNNGNGVADIVPPTTVSNLTAGGNSYRFSAWGANCAGWGPIGSLSPIVLP